MENPVLFVLATLMLLSTPGPTNTLLATSGATTGFKRSLPGLLAELAGYNLSIAIITFVSGAFLTKRGELAAPLRMAAGVYLMMLSVSLWRLRLQPGAAPISARAVFVTTLLNPKGLVFALVILPMNVPNAAAYRLSLCLLIPLVGTAWIYVGSILGRAASRHWSPAAIPRTAAVILALFSAALIVLPLLEATHS